MKKSRFTETQIVSILNVADAGFLDVLSAAGVLGSALEPQTGVRDLQGSGVEPPAVFREQKEAGNSTFEMST